jgi:hypothetical protein
MLRSLRILLVPLLVFICFFGHAQWRKDDPRIFDRTATPFNPKGAYHCIALKAVVLPLPLGNVGFLSTSLGVEFGLTKNQTIGVDGFYMTGGDKSDKVKDTAGVEHHEANDYHTNERAVFFSYRYYFNFRKLRENNGICLYSSCYVRYGKKSSDKDEAFFNDYVSEEEINKSIGVLVGSVFMFEGSTKWAWDVNIGPFLKNKDITTVYRENRVRKTKFESTHNMGIRIGATINYYFFR